MQYSVAKYGYQRKKAFTEVKFSSNDPDYVPTTQDSDDEMIEHYKTNSSPCSFLVEKLLAKWFTNIEYDKTTVKFKMDDIHYLPTYHLLQK